MAKKRGKLRLSVNGEDIALPPAPHLRCPKCCEVVLPCEDARRLGADAIAIYRRKHDLLIREQFGLGRDEFARLLRLGADELSRWESGRNVQTGTMDLLLRMVRDLPESVEYLRGETGSRTKVDEGLTDLANGRTVPHEQVMREASAAVRRRG